MVSRIRKPVKTRKRFKPGGRRIAAQHLSELLRSAVNHATALHAGLYSETKPAEFARLLGREEHGIHGNALVFRYRDTSGEVNGYCRLKPDNPRKDKDGDPIKYEAPSGEPNRPYFPPNVADFANDPSKEIILTEGEKKTLSLYQDGRNAVGVSGVWNWTLKRDRDGKGKPTGPHKLLPGLREIVWKGRTVYIAFDSDVAEKPGCHKAEAELTKALEKLGARVLKVPIPPGPKGEKWGVDDLLAAKGKRALTLLLKKAVPLSDLKPVAKKGKKKTAKTRKTPAQPKGDDGLPKRWPQKIEGKELLAETEGLLTKYLVLAEHVPLVIALWVIASWRIDCWDRFAHLVVFSKLKRSGKTRLLEILLTFCRRAMFKADASAAWVFRKIHETQPTLLIDEAQYLTEHSSVEIDGVIRRILNASITRGATVGRCGESESHWSPGEFRVYCPKVVAMKGKPDDTLADRCIPVPMRRKTTAHSVAAYRSRIVEAEGAELASKLRRWTEDHAKELEKLNDSLEPLPLKNDRMAELLVPLQAVLTLTDPARLLELRAFAEQGDVETDPHVLLLEAVQEVVATLPESQREFIETRVLASGLAAREPWNNWKGGKPITGKALGGLLGPLGIKPEHNKPRTKRGYSAAKLEAAWAGILAPLPHTPQEASNASNPSNPPTAKRRTRCKARKPARKRARKGRGRR
jgi:putative DNA primase/helicase